MFETPLKSLASGSTEGPMHFSNGHSHKPYSAAKIEVVPFVATLQVNNLSSDCVHVQ